MACCITSDSIAVKEGGAVTFNLATTNVKAGTLVSYTLAGTNNAAGSSASGTFTVDGVGKASVTVVVPANSVLNDAGTLTLSAAGKTSTVSVTDATVAPPVAPVALDPTYSIASSSASVTEGGAGVIFTLSTTNVAAGTTIAYSVTGTGNAASQTTSGVFTVDSTGKAVSSAIAVPANSTYGDSGTLQLALSNGKATSAAVAVTDSTPNTVASNTTFTLTTGANSFTGNSGNDTFDGSLSGTSMTFGAADSLDGGAGTDSLTVQINATGTYQALALKNIENISLIDTYGATLSLLGATGVTSVTSNGSTVATTVSNIGSLNTGLGVTNSAVGATFTFTSSVVSGSSDTATLTLNGQTDGTDIIDGVETLNIVSSGSANALKLTTAAAAKYVITGDQTLNLKDLPSTVLTVDASAATAGVTFNSDQSSASTITGGSGNDSITLKGTNVNSDKVDLGAGNDTVVFSANLATTDTVNGGDGNDTLTASSANLTGYSAPATPTITNFETLKVSDALAADLTVANVQASGISTLNLATGTGGTATTVTMASGAMTVKLGAALGAALTLTDTGTATTDSMALTNSGSVDVFAGKNLIVNGYETITINGSGTGTATTQTVGTITSTADTGGTTTVNFSGSNKFTTGIITAAKIDASGLTGSANFSNSGNQPVGVTSIIGSSNGDILVGSSTATSIDGGAGNDTITGADGNDTLVGGDGNDSITAGAGKDNINAGAGTDTIVLGDNYTSGDVINGGDGTDTLSITNASVTIVNALSISAVNALNSGLTNVERLTISDQLGQSLDIARIKSLDYIKLASGATDVTLSGLAANTTISNTGAVSTGLTATLADATSSTDVLNIRLVNAADVTVAALTTTDIETVNIDTSEATATDTVRVNTITTATFTGATTLNITGTEKLTITGNIGTATINASTSTGGVVLTGAATGSAMTITGSTAADSITGGVASDNISGGAGADTLLGGAGADTINGGTGADSITGGAGLDVISFGAADGATDTVVFGTAAKTSIDTISDFVVGNTNGDLLVLKGVASLLNSGTTSITNVTSTTTAGATNSNVLSLNFGAYYADADAVAAALASGGSITIGSGINSGAAANVILIYQAAAGGDVHIAMANVHDDGGFTAVTDVAVLVGVTTVSPTAGLLAANITT